MQAVVHRRYGSPDVLETAEIPRPAPAAGQVLLRVRAASANPGDWHILRADPPLVRLMGYGLLKPRRPVLGQDVAGTVEAVGAGVTGLRPGDAVFGECPEGGAFAEYACAPTGRLAPKPARLSFEQAAAVPVAGVTALRALRRAGPLRPGARVLVNGASGGVGTFAVQIARALGAEVTGVCSAANGEIVRALGAHRVMDYARTDFTRDGPGYDLILDAAASRPLPACRRALRPGGSYVLVGGSTPRLFQIMLLGPLLSLAGTRRLLGLVSETTTADLERLAGMIEAGQVRPVIDRRYALREVADALRYLETRRARGKVVITMESRPAP